MKLFERLRERIKAWLWIQVWQYIKAALEEADRKERAFVELQKTIVDLSTPFRKHAYDVIYKEMCYKGRFGGPNAAWDHERVKHLVYAADWAYETYVVGQRKVIERLEDQRTELLLLVERAHDLVDHALTKAMSDLDAEAWLAETEAYLLKMKEELGGELP